MESEHGAKSGQDNPYAPPAVSGTGQPAVVGEFEFDVEVTEADVRRAFQKPFRFLAHALIWSIPICFSGFSAVFLLMRGMWTEALTLGGCFLALAVLVAWQAWRLLGPGSSGARIKATPDILGRFQGTISDKEISFTHGATSSTYHTSSCCYAKTSNEVIEFAFEPRRLVIYYLPERAFAGGAFPMVAELLQSVAGQQAVPLSSGVVDQRLVESEKVMPFDCPANAVAFRGPLRSVDVFDSPIRETFRRAMIRALVVLAVIEILLSLFLFQLPLLSVPWVFVLVVILFLAWMAWKRIGIGLRLQGAPETIFANLAGYVSDDLILLSSALGRTYYGWEAFDSGSMSERTIALALPGKIGLQVILGRHQFESDADWERVCGIVEYHVPGVRR